MRQHGTTLRQSDQKRYARSRSVLKSSTRRDVECAIAFLEHHARWAPDERVEPGNGGSCAVAVPTSGGRALGMHGAHRVLAAQLWSRSSGVPRGASRKRGADDEDSVNRRARRLSGGVLAFDDGRTYYGARAGQMRGTDVHAQICCYVNLTQKHFDVLYPVVDKMTRDVLVHLRDEKKLFLIHAEYLAYSSPHGVATPVDVVAIDTKRRPARLVLVEVKTGYHGTGAFQGALGKRRDATFRAPSGFRHMDDSPLNRARSQILFAATILSLRHVERAPPVEGLVVHVTDGTVRSYGMGGDMAITQTNKKAMLALIKKYAAARARTTAQAQRKKVKRGASRRKRA